MISDNKTPFDRTHFLANLPDSSGCYLMFNADEQVIYVGKAKNLKRRVSSYFAREQEHPKTRALVEQIANIEVMLTHSEAEAFILEYTLIKKHNPRYNIIFRDDKSYPYLYVTTQHDFPALYAYRGNRKKEGRLFGPFPSSPAVYETLNLLQKIFPVRQCTDSFYRNRARPCLQYEIKRCTAPCVGLISKEDYAKDVTDTLAFLEGKSKQVIDDKRQAMLQAAKTLDFERAAQLRDQITQLETIQAKQYVASEKSENADVITLLSDDDGRVVVQLLLIRGGNVWGASSHFPQHAKDSEPALVLSAFLLQHYSGREMPVRIILGQEPDDKEGLLAWFAHHAGRKVFLVTQARGVAQKWLQLAQDNARQALTSLALSSKQQTKLLTDLQQKLGLARLPERMECFDISHLQGTNTVASCVVFIHGLSRASHYRQYNITGITGGDDPAAMRQVLQRRLLRGQQSGELPDLLIVDGGRVQLKMAIEQVAALGLQEQIMVLSIAKGEGRKAGLETFYRDSDDVGIQLDADDPVAHLLQRIRDEAHRFAISKQRHARKKSLASGLQDIAGIGAKTKTKLLRAFGNMAAIKAASVAQLASVEGVTGKQAQAVYDYFHVAPNLVQMDWD
jgi:excinuclease ABC subunit C